MNQLRVSLVAALAAALVACSGGDGSNGPAGAAGPAGPSMPVIQSLSATGLPAAPGGTVTVLVVAQSGEGLSLAYAWTASNGWDIQGSAQGDTVTLTAPASHGAIGAATITVTDGRGRVATAMATLGTAGNGAPVISGFAAAPAVMTRNVPGTIAVWAADPDGEALTYSWIVPPGFEVVSGATTSQPVVRATRFASGLVQVAVSDGTAITTAGLYLTTADGAWGVPELIELDNAGGAYLPQVAMNAAGNAIAVWAQGDGARDNIWANRYSAGSGWGTPQLIETYDGGGAGGTGGARIAMNGSGNGIAVWYQSDGARDNIWANRYSAGSGWGTAELIETSDFGAGSPEIAMDESGNAVAVWMQWDGTRYNICANRYLTGFGWGTAELIETDNAMHAIVPRVAMDGSGNAIAVWYQGDGARDNIWANRYSAGSGWGTPQLIETDNGWAQGAQVAMDGSGSAIAVWFQSDGTRANIRANRYSVASGWGTAELLETDNAGTAASPQIAIDGDGNAVAVWFQSDGTRYNIWANRYTAASGWGTAELIETDNGGHAEDPQVAVDGSGNAIAVWYQLDGTRFGIRASRYTAASGWGTAELVDSGPAQGPQVAMDGSGSAIAVWLQYDGTRNNVRANRFE